MGEDMRGRGTLAWLGVLVGASAAQAPTLDAIYPKVVRASELVTIVGEDFGAYQPGQSLVRFATESESVVGKMPHVWRDDFIQIHVPTGLAQDSLAINVETPSGSSVAVDVRWAAAALADGATVSFTERTQLAVDHFDVSGFLGATEDNMARTKDADVADVNGDGFPDLIDNNSNNVGNGTHSVLRLNQGGKFFTSQDWEPVNAADVGSFAVTVPPGGDYPENATIYDADFHDLNNDGLPDWIMAAANTTFRRVRVSMNGYQGQAANFLESSDVWLPGAGDPPGNPDDVAAADVNGDGFLDIAIGMRFSGVAGLLQNQNGETFSLSKVGTEGSGSIHDSFFIDANDDGYWDLCLVNESGSSRIWLHNGNLANPAFIGGTSFTSGAESGVAADFNGDGFMDLALGGIGDQRVYLNNPGNPGQFAEVELPDAVPAVLYDLEAGDIDLDGDADLIGVYVTTSAENTLRVWANDGTGTFSNVTNPASLLLPGVGPYQRMSADLIDFDVDGDLDLYLTGADGSGAPGRASAWSPTSSGRTT